MIYSLLGSVSFFKSYRWEGGGGAHHCLSYSAKVCMLQAINIFQVIVRKLWTFKILTKNLLISVLRVKHEYKRVYLSMHLHFKVDHESCYCALLLRINVIKIVLLLLLIYSPAFSFMSRWTSRHAESRIQLNYYFSKRYYFSFRIKQRIADSSDKELIHTSAE